MKGVIVGLYFNTKEKDKDGNFIQPVLMLDSEGERKRIYFPKSQKESLNIPGRPDALKKGDLIEISDVKESAGFLRGEESNVKVVGVDRRKKVAKGTDDKQMSIWKGQALNLAVSKAIDDNLFDMLPSIDDEDFEYEETEDFKKAYLKLNAAITKDAELFLRMIQEWQQG